MTRMNPDVFCALIFSIMGTNCCRSLILVKTNPLKPPNSFIIFISSHPFNLFRHIHVFYNVPLRSEASPQIEFSKMFVSSKRAFTENWLEVARTGWKSGNRSAAVQSFCQEIKKCKCVSVSPFQLHLAAVQPVSKDQVPFALYQMFLELCREASARIW